MKIKQKPYLTYDECDIIEEQVKYLISDEGEFKGRDENEIRQIVYNDYDLFELEWESFKEALSEALQEINKSENIFKIKGVNMGWRNLEGFKIML